MAGMTARLLLLGCLVAAGLLEPVERLELESAKMVQRPEPPLGGLEAGVAVDPQPAWVVRE